MSTTKNLLFRLGLLEPARSIARSARKSAQRVLHPVREALSRMPDPRFLLAGGRRLHPPYDQHLEELRRDGITRLRGEVSPQALTEMRASFETFAARLDAKPRVEAATEGDMTTSDEYYDAQSRQYSSNEPFTFCRALLTVCLKPELVALINAYLGKASYITQGVATRIEPNPSTGFGSFQWHHDAWGKRINLMIVLTDVGEGDQHMTYAKGSHRLRHPYRKYVDSRFTREEFAAYCGHLEVLNCTAQAGDVYIFDSNGIHSGNRSAGRSRDTFILEYTRLFHTVWAHRVPKEFVKDFSQAQLEPLRLVLAQDRSQRTLAPEANSWVDQLLRPGKWLN